MKKALGVVLVLLGLVAFFGGNVMKSSFRVCEEKRSTNGEHELKLPVEAGHVYKIMVSGDDEESALQKRAEVSFGAEVKDEQGQVLFEKVVRATSGPANDDSGRLRVTQSLSYTHEAKNTEDLSIKLNLITGDNIELAAYRDLPEILNLAPGIGIIVGFIGLILFIKGRVAAKKAQAANA